MIHLGRESCGDLAIAESREWLITNGIGGFACGTVSGLLSRHYHGLLVAALQPPLGRTLLLTQLDESVTYQEKTYGLATHLWGNGVVSPQGYRYLERFHLDGTTPVWTYGIGDALLEKRIWMQPQANTTYIRYHLRRGGAPIHLSLKALVNYRDYHGSSQGDGWTMTIEPVEKGVKVQAFEDAQPYYLLSHSGQFQPEHDWYKGFDLAMERYRGLGDRDDHLHAASLSLKISPGDSLLIAASTEANPNLTIETALADRQVYDQEVINQAIPSPKAQSNPPWVNQLLLAADQFVVDRPLTDEPDGKTVIAGYPWFGDWGRDTMISLPGLTLATGRVAIARTILRTFARYLDQGMLPNLFPDAGVEPEYNTVDAILWFFEAIRAYYGATQDLSLLQEIWPALVDVIDWHRRGTRYHIHLDHDGLLYAGEAGVQLTWMDAKVGEWVVTPRIGKPIEINALWYNALCTMAQIAPLVGQSPQDYQVWAQETRTGFQRFWNPDRGYCFDCLDGPDGNDNALRPNQIFAVSLTPPLSPGPLLSLEQQIAIVNTCGQSLLTSHGLRSLSPEDHQYVGQYGGGVLERDGAYHQGTTWGWLIGPYIQAHFNLYGDKNTAMSLLEPMIQHLHGGCLGTLSEIFDGDAPMPPRGCFAQAWTVAEVLRIWRLLNP